MQEYINQEKKKLEILETALKELEQNKIRIASIEDLKKFNITNSLFKIEYELIKNVGLFAFISIDFSNLSFFISEQEIKEDGCFDELDFSLTKSQISDAIKYLKEHIDSVKESEDEIQKLKKFREQIKEIEESIKELESDSDSKKFKVATSVVNEIV